MASSPRILTGFVRGTGKDSETFGDDEFLRPTDRPINIALPIGDPEIELFVEPFRWGGECRTEVHLFVMALDTGTIQIHGFTSFFEGTSEDTPHERDRELINFVVPTFSPSGFSNPIMVMTHMQNDGDSADVVISLQNFDQ